MTYQDLFVFDIDGTLLTTEHRILSSTKEGITLLKERGIGIMLASARPPKAIEPIVAELDLEPFYISLNGALVIRAGEILLDRPMVGQAVQGVIGRSEGRNLSVNVYVDRQWYIAEKNPYSDRESEIVGFSPQIRELNTIEVAHKILVIGEQKEIRALQGELVEFVPEVSASLSNPSYLEVVAKGVSKAQALHLVGETLEVPLQHIVVFGDGENDLPMLKIAGVGVAMGNAHHRLKEVASFVTGNNNEDGVLQGIRRVLELEV